MIRLFEAWAATIGGRVAYVQVCNRRDEDGKFTTQGNGRILLGFDLPNKEGLTWPKEMPVLFKLNSTSPANPNTVPLALGTHYYENPIDSLRRMDTKGEKSNACNNCGHIPGGHIPRQGGARWTAANQTRTLAPGAVPAKALAPAPALGQTRTPPRCEYDRPPVVAYDSTRKPMSLYRDAIMTLFKNTTTDAAQIEMDRCGARYGWCKEAKKVGDPCDLQKRKKCIRLPCALIATGSAMEMQCRPC